ncbi:MAG TPA: AraC family transcriptional regulator [Chitinophagaceae bacterium]|jgi:AraC-like DNA-binding protein|nr:AraC family transcriptional regulator [Chitinophagaceae bacterium]HMU57265.1 AraC family transcriptional regulator [Chitinophagaceae bacterium]
MILKLLSNTGLQLCSYEVQLQAPQQSFFHTVIQVSGAFGSIHITRIDLQHCTIWMADYNVQEPVTLHGFASQPVCRLGYYIPASNIPQESLPLISEQQVELSIIDNQVVSLPASYSKALFIHYHKDYFVAANGNIKNLFTGNNINETKQLPLNAAVLTVLNQIINASPASRIVHLYLEAKAKELLTLLHEIENPPARISALGEKEIAILRRVREIILEDLSRQYTIYELSKLAGTNAYTLKKNFRSWFGIHIHLFQHNCRMEKASQLLLTTNMSVKEIAYHVGYKNLSNFSELFKKYYGYPPSKTRE